MTLQCEFCERHPKWRMHKGDYERYSCPDHIGRVRWLISIDLPFPATYEFEAVAALDAS